MQDHITHQCVHPNEAEDNQYVNPRGQNEHQHKNAANQSSLEAARELSHQTTQTGE